jgi:hypothetical protein
MQSFSINQPAPVIAAETPLAPPTSTPPTSNMPFSINKPAPSIATETSLVPPIPSYITKFLGTFLPFTIIALALGVAAMIIQILITNNTVIYKDPGRDTFGGYVISDGLTIRNDDEIGLSDIFRQSLFGTRGQLSNFPASTGPLKDTDLLFGTSNIISDGGRGSLLLYDGSRVAYRALILPQIVRVPTELITPKSGWCSTMASFASTTALILTTSPVDMFALSPGDVFVWAFVLSSGGGLRALKTEDHGEFEVDLVSFFPPNTVRVPGQVRMIGTVMLTDDAIGLAVRSVPITEPTSGLGPAPNTKLTVRFRVPFEGATIGVTFSLSGSVRLRLS